MAQKALLTGTIIRSWHGDRGNDYVVLGISRDNKRIVCIKNNSINKDGSIHLATQRSLASKGRFHLELPVSAINNGVRDVSRISRVQGKRRLDIQHINALVRNKVDANDVISLTGRRNVCAPSGIFDARQATDLQ